MINISVSFVCNYHIIVYLRGFHQKKDRKDNVLSFFKCYRLQFNKPKAQEAPSTTVRDDSSCYV